MRDGCAACVQWGGEEAVRERAGWAGVGQAVQSLGGSRASAQLVRILAQTQAAEERSSHRVANRGVTKV